MVFIHAKTGEAMQDLVLAFAAVTAISAAGVVVVAVLWLRKLRESVSSALAESTNQQVQTARRFSEAISEVQKQQRDYEQQLQNLAQANSQLRQGLVSVASQLQHGQADAARNEPTIH
jgi:signal transduction protein with GAF and PtsI domain